MKLGLILSFLREEGESVADLDRGEPGVSTTEEREEIRVVRRTGGRGESWHKVAIFAAERVFRIDGVETGGVAGGEVERGELEEKERRDFLGAVRLRDMGGVNAVVESSRTRVLRQGGSSFEEEIFRFGLEKDSAETYKTSSTSIPDLLWEGG